MPFPLISRAAYEAIREERDTLHATLADERERYERLVQEMLAFRREGFDKPAEVIVPVTDMPPDILMHAMRAVSPVPDRAYEANYAYAMSLREHWDNDERMTREAAKIRRGAHTTDEN